MVRSQQGGMVEKRVGPWGRGVKSAKRSDHLSIGRVGDSTHGVEASQDLDDQEKREERREKREETSTIKISRGIEGR